ncbi:MULTISPECIES: tyrosine-type recombinase/integrase [Halomicrobium]|uniref:Phage integrase/site-specific recombinase n=2 Tax=Halomicrobium mukohataei TaxID=57705 RepID=C7P3Z1_HALMD|nr:MULTISPECIES: site-specific integrase [Halomicrobium]ACV47813.1 phage integrase/site-specific recombinase [Halomicrobium mukohataei DSM 12286]QCD66261.1 site-specific integrase [Halomicrobium mukohataei]QFR21067.1 tyrosine-type recombinase/integrase [Halomicrobium sp. ZPS1]
MTDAPDLSPREAMERYLNHRKTESAAESVKSWRYRLKIFVDWTEEKEGIEAMSDLTGWTLDEYETHRRGQDLAASTLNGEMQTLKNWLEYLARIGVVDDGLPEKVHVPSIPDGEGSNDEMLDPDDAAALIRSFRETPERYGTAKHAVLELLWFTGCRVGAARSLDLRDYHSAERFVTFHHRDGTPLKNDSDGERAVGLPESVCEVLDYYIEHYRETSHDGSGRKPLFTTTQGRSSENTLRVWTYLATQPCLFGPCPHGEERDACEYVHVHHASKCPSSLSPHRIRTGSITWQRDCGLPAEIVGERVNATLEVIEKYYDQATERQRLEQRRRPYITDLQLDTPSES